MNHGRIIAFAGLLVSSVSAFANSVGVEAGLYKIDYREHLTMPQKSTESGTPKVFGLVANQIGPTLQWNERVSYAKASLKYDGSTLDTNQPVTATHDHTFMTGEVTVAYPLTPDLRLYTGLLYRQWNRELGAYEEDYKLFIMPVGFRYSLNNAGALNMTLDASLRPLVYGWLDVDFRSSGYDNTRLSVNRALGWRIETPIMYKVGAEAGLVFTPFYQTIEIGEGGTKILTSNGQEATAAEEPASTTHEYGARLTLLLGF